ncbi:MAG TPA: signal peptide peptidase SppA [Gammaproteobacteria bacterium]|nr:signal peptide peptidase SppA [Gammaproteobacteria bacterium]
MSNHPIVNFLRGVWRTLDGLRRVLHLLLLLVLVLFLLAVLTPHAPAIPRTAALVVAPRGVIVEQLTGDPLERAFAELTGDEEQQTLLRDLLEAVEAAKDDDRIQALVLDLEELTGAGLSKLQALAAAVDEFKAAGKRVVAVSGFYGQQQYLLAAHADEVYVHPYGVVFLDGYGYYRTYYKSAIDKLLIDWNVFKVGEYKSYAEPFLRDDMSPEDEQASRVWLEDLWSSYQEDVTGARELAPGALAGYVAGMVPRLREHDGDMARLALDADLVDGVWHYDEVRTRLIELVGEDTELGSFNQVSHADYLRAVRTKHAVTPGDGDQVGVIVAAGTILEGEQPPGTIGSDTIVELIREARDDEAVKAVVLRIDSGGGSVFASEVIRRELEILRGAGKPVIASMSSVAASGGYWIAMPADEILAADTTLTGSIGIVAMFPTVQRTLDRIGLNVDGVGTTPLSGQFRFDRELNEPARDILTLSIENGYREFITKVAEARGKPVEDVDEVAGGRVWSGEDALELGLVDRLGDLDAALDAAADLAGLGDDYAVRYIEPELSIGEMIAVKLAGTARGAFGSRPLARPSGAVARALDSLLDNVAMFERLNDPRNVYSLCFCTIE